ncbi:hypothetical protein DAPPUDRAFT_250145 [Daphnia pulex]|uniref:Uncharacterized protein n=1 Tax=Daphnia pulex TaxID=6669 RepID=E9GY05_DAPPU|nr:hypothetical protein DAPPUDRAFT_250145 [Daphnia pulex]|eukprot:EFX75515.1 hypothetical protein DAPPUDRAFT_250145 [Daphnia pulex]
MAEERRVIDSNNASSENNEGNIPVEVPHSSVTVIRLKAKHDGGDGSEPKSWWRT